MIEEMYEKNLKKEIHFFENLKFHEILKSCRELMGLKQYACSEYLGFDHPRYKKLELGKFRELVEEWEIKRLETFFKLPIGLLQSKQKVFLNMCSCGKSRKGICQSIWCNTESTRGEREKRAAE